MKRIGNRVVTRTAAAGMLALGTAICAAAVALRPSGPETPRSVDPAARRAVFERLARDANRQARSPHSSGKVHFDLLAKLLADDRRGTSPGECLARLDKEPAAAQIATQSHPLLGQPAPDFTLRDHEERAWRLADHCAAGPVVIVFYLGYGCDACVHHLFELDADLSKFRALGAEVVAISGDSPATTRERFDRYGAFHFPVLSDPNHRVAQTFEVDPPTRFDEPPERSHATFVLRQGGVIAWAHRSSTPFRETTALLIELRRQAGEGAAPAIETDVPHRSAEPSQP